MLVTVQSVVCHIVQSIACHIVQSVAVPETQCWDFDLFDANVLTFH